MNEELLKDAAALSDEFLANCLREMFIAYPEQIAGMLSEIKLMDALATSNQVTLTLGDDTATITIAQYYELSRLVADASASTAANGFSAKRIAAIKELRGYAGSSLRTVVYLIRDWKDVKVTGLQHGNLSLLATQRT